MSPIPQEHVQALRDRIGRVGVWLGSIAVQPVTPERAAIARIEELGYGAAWFGESDPVRARELARRHMAGYLKLPNYVNNLRSLGYEDNHFADGGSERLVDAIVAWGDEDEIAARVGEHLEAGADHVAVQAYAETADQALASLERLAPRLLSVVLR